MKSSDFLSNRLAFDPTAAGDLRGRLRNDPQAGVKQAAQQFEGLLLQMMLKSMREATPGDGLLDSDQTRFFTALGDQQMAQGLAAQSPLGLAGVIEKQFARPSSAEGSGIGASTPLLALQKALTSRQTTSTSSYFPPPKAVPTPIKANATVTTSGSTPTDSAGVATGSTNPGARAFVDRIWPHAVEAAATTGVPPHFLVAHAALESGWGRREIRAADGSQSFNLFGIKAGRGWSGAAVEQQTTEFANGQAQSERARFRVYGSYAEAFGDYAQLLSSRPRFAEVIGQQDGAQFARALQRSGYATDPMYADKLARIISGNTLRQALTET